MPSRQSVYVVDTHPLWWHLTAQSRLSTTAREVFRQAQAGEAVVIVPAIVVAELYYLSAKLGTPIVPAEFMGELAENGMTLTELGWPQLESLDRFPDIPEMHDRLIACESTSLGATLLTREQVLSDAASVETLR